MQVEDRTPPRQTYMAIIFLRILSVQQINLQPARTILSLLKQIRLLYLKALQIIPATRL